MSVPTHKNVNGVRIALTTEEKAEFSTMWTNNSASHESEKAAAAAAKLKKEQCFADIKKKLNLTDEEIEALRG